MYDKFSITNMVLSLCATISFFWVFAFILFQAIEFFTKRGVFSYRPGLKSRLIPLVEAVGIFNSMYSLPQELAGNIPDPTFNSSMDDILFEIDNKKVPENTIFESDWVGMSTIHLLIGLFRNNDLSLYGNLASGSDGDKPIKIAPREIAEKTFRNNYSDLYSISSDGRASVHVYKDLRCDKRELTKFIRKNRNNKYFEVYLYRLKSRIN